MEGIKHPLVILGNGRCAGNMLSETLAFRLFNEGNMEKHFHFGGVKNSSYDDMVREDLDKQFWLFMGHFTYGIHQLIGREVDYFMNIRETGERLLSKVQQWGGDADPELFLKSDFDLDNGVTKRLAGLYSHEGMVRQHGSNEVLCVNSEFRVTEDIFATAKKHFANVPVTIVRERLAESFVMFEHSFNLPPLFCLRFFNYNRSSRRLELSNDFMTEVRNLNRFDQYFYETCNSALDKFVAEAGLETLNEIEARKLATKEISGIESDFTDQTLTDSAKKIIGLINRLFADQKIDLAYEVLYLLVVYPGLAISVRKSLVDSVRNQPNSYAKDKVEEALRAPPTLSNRWQ